MPSLQLAKLSVGAGGKNKSICQALPDRLPLQTFRLRFVAFPFSRVPAGLRAEHLSNFDERATGIFAYEIIPSLDLFQTWIVFAYDLP